MLLYDTERDLFVMMHHHQDQSVAGSRSPSLSVTGSRSMVDDNASGYLGNS